MPTAYNDALVGESGAQEEQVGPQGRGAAAALSVPIDEHCDLISQSCWLARFGTLGAEVDVGQRRSPDPSFGAAVMRRRCGGHSRGTVGRYAPRIAHRRRPVRLGRS